MMNSFLKPVKFMVSSPFTIMVPLACSLLIFCISYLLSAPVIEMLLDIFIGFNIPKAGFMELPKALAMQYPAAVLSIAMIIFLSLFLVMLQMLYISAKVMDVKAGFPKLLKKATVLAVFFLCVSALFAFLFLLSFSLAAFSPILSTLLSLAFLVAAAMVFFRVIFLPSAYANEERLRKAIEKCWSAAGKKMLENAGFVVALAFISGIGGGFFIFLADFIQADLIFIALSIMIPALFNAYTFSALAFRYAQLNG